MYNIQYETKAFKFLKKCDAKLRNAIMDKVKRLEQNPFSEELDIKKLKGREGYRLRVGDYRVLYTVNNDIVTIYIVDIAHRKEVYQ